jgi:hypothetical protein
MRSIPYRPFQERPKVDGPIETVVYVQGRPTSRHVPRDTYPTVPKRRGAPSRSTLRP